MFFLDFIIRHLIYKRFDFSVFSCMVLIMWWLVSWFFKVICIMTFKPDQGVNLGQNTGHESNGLTWVRLINPSQPFLYEHIKITSFKKKKFLVGGLSMVDQVMSQPYFFTRSYQVNPPSIFIGTRLDLGLISPGSQVKLSGQVIY
jgi:hypothetical protein